MFVGLYPGAIGETSALVILVVGVILAIRKVIDWRVPATYLITLFVLAAGVGLMHGAPISYALFHLLTGGAMFGAVFMMTDPVTNPTSAAGRIMFAVGCAVITIVLRLRSNLPEGVMYSILIMNMLTPLIESLTDGQQIKMKSKNIRNLAILFVAVWRLRCWSAARSNQLPRVLRKQARPTVRKRRTTSRSMDSRATISLRSSSTRPRARLSASR